MSELVWLVGFYVRGARSRPPREAGRGGKDLARRREASAGTRVPYPQNAGRHT